MTKTEIAAEARRIALALSVPGIGGASFAVRVSNRQRIVAAEIEALVKKVIEDQVSQAGKMILPVSEYAESALREALEK